MGIKNLPADYWMIDLDRANRMLASMELSVEIQSSGDEPLYRVKGSDAIIPVRGLLSRYYGMFAALGHSCYERIEAGLEAALVDESVDRIILDIDSPGGEIRGLGYCTKAIKEAPKPTLARVAGQGCSAALYLALAADEIEADSNAELGSIGMICMAYRPRSKEAQERDPDPYVEFVSAVSPLKIAGIDNPEVEANRQQLANDYGEEFVAWVAERRKVDRDYVLEHFGRGSTMSAARALSVGLIDRVVHPGDTAPITTQEVSEPAKEKLMSEEEMKDLIEQQQAKIAELEAMLAEMREKTAESEEAEEAEGMSVEAQALANENAQLRDRVAALEASAKKSEMDRVIEGALAQGKLTPAERETAEKVYAKGLFDEVYGSRKPGSMIPQPKGHGQAVETKSIDDRRHDAITAKMSTDNLRYPDAAAALVREKHPLFINEVK